jgi:NTE family protein
VLARAWPRLEFKDGTATAFTSSVVAPLREFCRRHVDAAAIVEGLLSPWTTSSERIEEAYARDLVTGTLHDLVDTPRFIFGATNLQTGRSFRFSKRYMGDYRIGLVDNPTISLARVIAASSAFPPFLSPVTIENPGTFKPVPGSDLSGDSTYTKRLLLTDGGVYDNLGLETVWNRCRTVLVSDAGAPFGIGPSVNTDSFRQTLRAMDIATDQSRGLRKRALIDDFKRGERKGTYWGIDTTIGDYGLADALPCKDTSVHPLAKLRTRLDAFDDIEQGQLINWGYALCDAAIRTHALEVITRVPPPSWPCPNQRLDQ